MLHRLSILLILLAALIAIPRSQASAHPALQLIWTADQPALIPVALTGDPTLTIASRETRPTPLERAIDATALPRTPAWIARTATLRGQRYAVIQVAPTIQVQGGAHTIRRLELTISNARPVTTRPMVNAGLFGPPVPPTNPQAESRRLIVRVTEPGMQEIRASDLAAHGLALPLTSTALHLWAAGKELALDIRDGGDGRLDAADHVRFWMPRVGDRWNTTTQVWLSLDATRPGRRMGERAASTESAAPLRTTALGMMTWRDPQVYESRQPGPSGDHWASRRLRAVTGGAAAAVSIPLTLPHTLASAPITVTLSGMSTQVGAHQLQVAAGAAVAPAVWSGAGTWQQIVTLPAAASPLTFTLGAAGGDDVQIDTLQVTTTMRLNDLQGASARWQGVGGTWRYALGNLPLGRALYDLTDPAKPVRVTLPTGRNVVIAEEGARAYALVADADLERPTIASHQPQPLPSTGTALVIAPQAFLPALQPLASARAAQGSPLTLIAVEALYDRWSWGQIDPAAIRAFLRHAAATWPAAPTSVLLVGDGTSDPHDYLGFGNPTLIPPYLALVDPWIGETSCDSCYAQLDGAEPLDDALPDLAIGRLPARTVAEVETLVEKLIRYDTLPYGSWQGRVVNVADNMRSATGAIETVNDFAGMAVESEAWFPAGTRVTRIFYDPDPATSTQLGHEADAHAAYLRTRAALGGGAAIVQYLGHGSSWQWAYTAPTSTPSHLFGIQDAETLHSAAGLPVVLAWTCATSTIQLPSVRGSTIDEALVLNPGGAIATWGSSGLGVAYGHQYLHQGFARTLTTGDRDLGTLTMAGIWELWSVGQCCTDAIRTYHLLGDPLTRLKFQVGHQVMLPLLAR